MASELPASYIDCGKSLIIMRIIHKGQAFLTIVEQHCILKVYYMMKFLSNSWSSLTAHQMIPYIESYYPQKNKYSLQFKDRFSWEKWKDDR